MNDVAREHAVELIQQAYADGRLGLGELERRLERALTAASPRDLAPVVADLPADLPGEETVELASTGGRILRTGDWAVPRRLRIESEYGRARLDLSRAHVPHSRIDIELRLAYGSATIILPARASANTDGVRTEWGRVTCTAPGRPHPGRLHVNITGELPYGRLAIRNARR